MTLRWRCADAATTRVLLDSQAVVLPVLTMKKINISLEDDLYQQVRAAAGSDGVSGWLATAAASHLRQEALSPSADEIAQATGGPYSDREISEAHEWLPSSSTPEG
jgi:hypothetical protein